MEVEQAIDNILDHLSNTDALELITKIFGEYLILALDNDEQIMKKAKNAYDYFKLMKAELNKEYRQNVQPILTTELETFCYDTFLLNKKGS